VTGRVTVDPPTFTLVDFDPAEITNLVEGLLDQIGLDRPVRIEVDETTPLGHAQVRSVEPIVLAVESGAMEDSHRIRQLSARGTVNVLGVMLLRTRDRLDPSFGDPPADEALPLDLDTAWDVYASGRLVRLGHANYDERQRRLYQFRTRHGFSDASDASFEALWDGDGLSWADIEQRSADAKSPQAASA
jgi:hypothetical protein